jgi:O-antigen/teichoic acid export membrane protein
MVSRIAVTTCSSQANASLVANTPQMPHMSRECRSPDGSASISPVATEAAAPPPNPEPRRLRTDVFLTFGGKIAVLIMNVAATAIVARALGPSGRGTLAVAFALTMILVQLGSIGFATANPYYAAKDPASRARIVANSLWISAALGTALILTAIAIKIWAPSVIAGLNWLELAIALSGVPASLATLFLQSILVGEGRMVAYNVVEVVFAVLPVAALAVGFWVFDFDVTGALVVMSSGYWLGAGFYLALLLRHRPSFSSPDIALFLQMAKYGFRVYVATLLAFLVIRIDLLMVNSYLGAREAGLYSVAVAFVEGMYLLPTVIGLNLFARIARGGPDEMSAEVFRSVAVVYGLFCLVSVPLAAPAVRVLFGAPFEPATGLYYWIVPGAFSLGMLTILSHHFAGRGFPLEAMLIWFVGLAINLAINVAFLADEGTYIASLSSSIAYTILLFLHVRLFARQSGGYSALRPRLREVVRFVRVAVTRGAG